MKMDKYIALGLTVLLFATMGLAGCSTQEKPAAATEKYPNKPITLIVPFAAGGSVDLMSRTIEKFAPKYLGQPLVVTNMPGGASTIGLNELVKSPKDGYTVGIVGFSSLLQPLYGTANYHYPTALEPLVQVMDIPAIAVVRANSQWNNIEELIKYAKQHPGEIKYGHPGLGTGNHVAGEMLTSNAHINLSQVPFKGEADALAALLGEHIQLVFTTPPSIKEHVKSGKVKVLGVATTERLTDPVFNSIPTFKEQGIDVVLSFWYGFGVPKGLPQDVKERLVSGLERMVNDPEFQNNMKNAGTSVEFLAYKEFTTKWIEDNKRVEKIVKETGIAEKIAAQKK